mmetsp:Transcript_6987/g.12938  ORF Transcript_6987/g.12938 Transcript_6987/m.12938 type:complete len:346 (-) Transcript_6987:239-1276(-)
MGHFCSSCWHPHAKLSFADKAVNLVVGSLLPLGKFHPGQQEEDTTALLQKCRKAILGLNAPGYKKAVEGLWEVAEETICKPEGSHGAGVRVLLHTPKGHESSGALPLIVWAHGGGCTLGGPDEAWGAEFFKDLATKMCDHKFCWASVDYRLSPEAKFPSGVDDMLQAYARLKDPSFASRFGYDPQKISLGGISAGAFMANHAALRLARDSQKDRPAFLASLYPMADPACQGDSHQLFGDLPMCPTLWIRWSWRALLSESLDVEPSEERVKEASLVQMDWSPCKGLTVLNVVAPFDALRDEGKTLSKAMAAGGVNVEEANGGGSHAISKGGNREAILSHFSRLLSL